MLDYVRQFVDNYAGLNKWAHVQSLSGHEDSGTVVGTLDQDLADVIEALLASKDDIVLMLMADHGMRYGEWFKVLDGSHEHKLPMLFMVASTSLLRRVPNSLDTLTHNTNRLVSKLDLYKTLKHLGNLPYNTAYTVNSQDYRYYWYTSALDSVSLLIEKISNSRNCDSVDIPVFFCSCLKYFPVSEESYSSNPYSKALLDFLAAEAVRAINEQSYTPLASGYNRVCRKVSLKTYKEVQVQKINHTRHLYKFDFSVNEHPSANFEVVVMYSVSWMKPRRADEGYPLTFYHLEGRKGLRILYIKRTDTYAGLCEEVCKLKEIYPPLCICEKIDFIKQTEPGTLTRITDGFSFTLGDVGESCTEACIMQDKLCVDYGIHLLNTCDSLSKLTSCPKCYDAENQRAYPGQRGDYCLLSKQPIFGCEARSLGVMRGCACKGGDNGRN